MATKAPTLVAANQPAVERTLEQYLSALASASPTPGGGSAATVVAAAAAALVAMVARICACNPAYAQWTQQAGEAADRADGLRAELLALRGRDEAAFDRVVAAQAMPKQTPAQAGERGRALQTALAAAAAEPLHGAHLALLVLEAACTLLAIPNRNLASDLGCAGEFAAAGLAACAYNVRVNHRFMRDEDTIADQARELASYERQAAPLLDTLRCAVARHLERPR